jgi:hypothetical protein
MPTTLRDPRAEALRQPMFGGAPGDAPELQNHPTQSATTIDGWKSFLFGIPFLACGLFILAGALHLLPSHKNAPNWLLALFGCFFVFGGVFFSLHGLLGVLRKAAYNRNAVANPGQPWLADHHWHKEGISFSAFYAMLGRLMSAILWNAFLVPFFWVGWHVPGMGRIFLIAASLFALIGLIFWARWLSMFGELIRYGNSFLAYDSFPYFLGSPFQARLRVSRPLDSLEALTVTLRCVQEKYVTRGVGKNRNTQVVCCELYKDVATFTREKLAGAASSYLPISFRLPDNQPATRLVDTPPTYWEIEARGVSRSSSFEAYFLIPVYRPQ